MVYPITRSIHATTLSGSLKTIPLGGDFGVVVFEHRVQQRRAQLIFGPVSKGEGDDRTNQLQQQNDDQ